MKRYIQSYEVINLDIKHENDKYTTLYDCEGCMVDIEYYWQPNSGDLVPFKGPNGKLNDVISTDKVAIIEHTWTAIMYGNKIEMGSQELYINDIKQPVEVDEFWVEDGVLYVDAIVGGS